LGVDLGAAGRQIAAQRHRSHGGFTAMKSLIRLAQALLIAGTAACASAEDIVAAEAAPAVVAAPAELAIVQSPMPADCFGVSTEKRTIDTVVVHYASAIYWYDKDFQKIVGEEGSSYAKSIELTPETLAAHKYDWQLVKAVFAAYKVSSHYMIARDGTVVQIVPDNDIAWHAGKSTMPTDGREKVNSFSLGIELMASHPDDDPTVKTFDDAYTAAQYESLNKLIAQFCKTHPITAVVGHDEIAPGRKTDPGPLFQWDKVRSKDFKPLACAKPATP
jgi:hypothetical protein